jgi:glutaredoxin 3
MLELFGSASCRFTDELRDDLEWDGRDFVEHDVEADADALARMLELTDGQRTVPVLVEDGCVVQIGVGGRGCVVGG